MEKGREGGKEGKGKEKLKIGRVGKEIKSAVTLYNPEIRFLTGVVPPLPHGPHLRWEFIKKACFFLFFLLESVVSLFFLGRKRVFFFLRILFFL